MALKKRAKTIQGMGTSRQALKRPPWTSNTSTNARTQGNAPRPLRLTDLAHIARFNALNSGLIVATRQFNEDFLTNLSFMNDIRRLFG